MKKARLSEFLRLVCLSFLILIPWAVLSLHFHQTLEIEAKRRQKIAEASLVSEMKNFRQSLLTRVCIERIMHDVESSLQLVAPDKNFDFNAQKDALIYDRNTPERIARFLEEKYRIKADYILSFGYQGKHLEQLFIHDFSHRSTRLKDMLKRLVGYFVAETLIGRINSPFEFTENFQISDYAGRKISLGKNEVNNVLRIFFSGLGEFPENLGVCFQYFSSRTGGNQAFFYANGLNNRKKLFGGFFVVFSDRQFPPEFLLKMALSNDSKIFKRSYIAYDPEKRGKFSSVNHRISYFEAFSPDFLNLYHEKMYTKTGRQPRFMLKISASERDLTLGLEQMYLRYSFVQRLFILFFFTAQVYFLLYGRNKKPGIRLKFLTLTSFIVLVPFLAMSYFSILLLDNFTALNQRKIEIESALKMFEVSRFLDDLRIRRQLLGIVAKKRLSDLIYAGDIELRSPEAERIIPAALSEGIDYVSINGEGRHINISSDNEAPRSMNFLLATKYLNNLGVLNAEKEKNRRALKLSSLAGGFLDDLGQNYIEGRTLAKESQECKDLGELSDLHRMLYFVMPGNPLNVDEIAGISFIHLFGLSRFASVFDNLGQNPKVLLNEEKELASHRFAIARRSFQGLPEKYYPPNLGNRNSLKLLLDNAVLNKSSGQLKQVEGNETSFSTWKYIPDQEYLIAGITTARPDLWLSYLSSIFPLLIFLFCFLSIVLISDFLFEFLVEPVFGFLAFIKEVRNDNFKVRIEIQSGDEFHELAGSFNEMAAGLEEREKLRRFVSEKLFQEVESDFELEKSVSMESEITLLASDIRGFTSLTEKYEASEIVELLNEYFTFMGKAISENGGVIERFVGDAIVAAFYPDSSGVHRAERAVRAAKSMRRSLQKLNAERKKRNRFLIENGIGIVSGRAFSAITGASSGRKVFTIIGSVVRQAEKLEAQTAISGGSRILVCRETAKNCGLNLNRFKGAPEIEAYIVAMVGGNE